ANQYLLFFFSFFSVEGFDEQKLKEIIAEGELDFDGWTKLISEVENFFHDEIENICLVYDSFLPEFPLCYGYWRRYADHMMRLCTIDKAVDVFERAVQSATYSIDVWVDYCGFSKYNSTQLDQTLNRTSWFGLKAHFFSLSLSVPQPNEKLYLCCMYYAPALLCSLGSLIFLLYDMSMIYVIFLEIIDRLFKRAMSYVGKDYLCHTLWDKYVEFEFSREQWSSLANVYIQTLRFPSKKLHHYYESFQKLVATWKEEMQCPNHMDLLSDPRVENEVSSCHTDAEISCIIKDLLDAYIGMDGIEALAKYLSIGKQFYREASELDEKIHHFEAGIRRPYFHVKELDISQLDNWHEYLNFVEMHGDFDWAVKLYERCLIPCANYPEFWMRYVDFMESKGGREIANFALARAAEVFLKRMPVIHLFTARFKEKIRDVSGAHIALLHYEKESDLSFVETVSIKANMEKRLGNFVAASNVYKEAMEIAAGKQKFDILPILYINFSRLQYMITSNSDAARDILIDGIKCLPHCKLLLEELIKFGMMHGGPRDIHVLDAIINDVISLRPSQGMDAKEAEEISSLYLQ
ncbi:hypothetical protein Gohar_023527, partial [Gossypium harknessii]|nr:hypothetical protein [Gossypium harknessii]